MENKSVTITTEFIKLDQLLKLAGLILTGGQAKEEILSGKVKVNDEICMMRGKKLRPGDTVSFENCIVAIRSASSERA